MTRATNPQPSNGVPLRPGTTWPLLVALLIVPFAGGCGDTTGPDDGADPLTQLPRALTADEQAVIARSTGFVL